MHDLILHGLIGGAVVEPPPDPGSMSWTGPTGSRTGTIQSWIVPHTGLFKITAKGGRGGGPSGGGLGAIIVGTFSLTAGQTLKVLAGSTGHLGADAGNRGGGGGSFVWVDGETAEPLIVAGGGGGTHSGNSGTALGMDASITTSGTARRDGNGTPGTGGQGAPSGGGAGWKSNGGVGTANGGTVWAQSPLNGGSGGDGYTVTTHYGGFGGGGGGGGAPSTTEASGGGGGYSGGAGQGTPASVGGGGGGSYNAGTSPSNTVGNTTVGSVLIEWPG